MKLKRKKVGDSTYELVDVEVGDVVARVSKTGETGRDNYPWDWHLEDTTVEFGDSGLRTGGSAQTLAEVIDYIKSNGSKYGLTYRRDLRAADEAKKLAEKRANSALTKMVAKLDARNKRTSQGYVTNRDELVAILSELTPLLSVAILEEERPYSVTHKEISVTVKLGFTLERELL